MLGRWVEGFACPTAENIAIKYKLCGLSLRIDQVRSSIRSNSLADGRTPNPEDIWDGQRGILF
jgi:hypothetical protein